MRRQIARELRKVSAGLDELRRPAEARRHVAAADGAHDLAQVARIHGAQQPLGALERHRPLRERDDLLQRRQRVAHSAVGTVRDEVERLALELHALGNAHRTQARH